MSTSKVTAIAVNLLRLIRKLTSDVSLEVRTQPYIVQKKQLPLNTHAKLKLQMSTKLSGLRRAGVPSEEFWN